MGDFAVKAETYCAGVIKNHRLANSKLQVLESRHVGAGYQLGWPRHAGHENCDMYGYRRPD